MAGSGGLANITRKITRITGFLDFLGAASFAVFAIGFSIATGGVGLLAIAATAVSGLLVGVGVAKQRVAADAKTAQMVQAGIILPEQAEWKSGALSRGLVRFSGLANAVSFIASVATLNPVGAVGAAVSGAASGAELHTAHSAAKQKQISSMQLAREQAGEVASSMPRGIMAPLPVELVAEKDLVQKSAAPARSR